MSVEEPEVVDAIGVDKATGRVVLTIADHLDWNDEQEHLRLLQNKINTYLRFVESGEIFDEYPKAHGRHIEINIVGQCSLNETASEFLRKAQEAVSEAGYVLTFRLLTE